ncbi:MAG TPA: extradiol ring-cleavage dioxygenase [Candidatus Binatia bacterium]|nr:extradiol ring-cleavage dioxygenase [Candidatus Binatia bacterium]
MARIVLGLGTSHSPQLSTPSEIWPLHAERDRASTELYGLDGRGTTYEELLTIAPESLKGELTPEKWRTRYDACQRAIAKEAETISMIGPDVLIMIGDDQHEIINDDNMPAILIYWGETIANVPSSISPALGLAAWAYGEEERDYPVESRLGRHLVESLMGQRFDIAQSRFLRKGQGMGHAFSFVYRRILNNRPVPTVPIMLNTYYPPNQPSAERCYELGRAIRAAVESWDADARIAIIASGGLSHFVVDEELDNRVIRAMKNRDATALARLPSERLTSGSSEIRNWIAVSAAAEHLEMKLIDYAPCYRSPAGTGVGMAFAEWA